MKHLGKLAVLGAVLAASAPFASATSIDGGDLNASAFTTSIGTPLALNVVSTSAVSGTNSIGQSFTATYTESIYQGTNGLNFVFNVQNAPGSTDYIDNLSISNFGSFTTTEYEETGTGADTVSTASNNLGGINIVFTNVLTAGQTLDTFVIETNAPNYQAGNITFQQGATAGGPAVVASNATPEPSSLLLLGTGLLGTAGILMRKRQTA